MNFASPLLLPLFLHPLFVLVLGLIAGIFVKHLETPHLVTTSFAIAAFSIIAYGAHQNYSRWHLFALCGLLGVTIGFYRMHYQVAKQQHMIAQLCNKRIDCLGTITDLQISHDYATKNRITLNIKKFKACSDSSWMHCDANVFIYCKTQPSDLRIGDTLFLESIILRHNERNKLFNNYLLKEDIAATAFLQKATYSVTHRSEGGFGSWIHTQREFMIDRLRNRLSSITLALFTSLFLGNRNEQKQEQERVAQQSKNWGTSHHLARSGLHLVIFIYLLILLLRFLPISLFAKEYLLLTLCVIYHIFSWSSISFVRAFITFVCYKLCTLLGFPSHILHVLTITTALILIYNPIQLFFLDFQLSFGLTFILAWFNAAYLGKNIQ